MSIFYKQNRFKGTFISIILKNEVDKGEIFYTLMNLISIFVLNIYFKYFTKPFWEYGLCICKYKKYFVGQIQKNFQADWADRAYFADRAYWVYKTNLLFVFNIKRVVKVNPAS